MMLTAAEVSALVLSIKAASLSLLLILPPGLLIGWILAKFSFPGKSLLNTVVMLPMVLPPVVSGFFLLILLSKRGLIGGLLFRLFGLEIVFSWLAVVLAISVLVVSVVGAWHRHGDGGGEPTVRECRKDARCLAVEGVLYCYAASVVSWDYRRSNYGIFSESRRIWCDHDGGGEHSGKDADVASGNL